MIVKKIVDSMNLWTISGQNYIKVVLNNVVEGLRSNPYLVPSKAVTPMEKTCQPEIYASYELDAYGVQYYQELIGILSWANKLGPVNIFLEVLILSEYHASPRVGNLEQVLHIFYLLRTNTTLHLWMDPKEPSIYYDNFSAKKEDFLENYCNAKEDLPFNMPGPRGAT